MEKEKLFVMFSGGETSAFMVDYLVNNKRDKYDMTFVFCNTSKEREETLIFANQIDKKYNLNLLWIEATFDEYKSTGYRITDFENAKRKGEVFEEMIKCYGLPCKPFPHCTRELKTSPANRLIKDLSSGEYLRAIGIRADEIDRVSNNRKEERFYYPLIEDVYTTKQHVNRFWNSQDFRLQLKGYEGNCDLCWKKSNRKLLTLIIEKPELVGWWDEMELKYSDYYPEHRNRKNKGEKMSFFRKNLTIQDLVKMSKDLTEKAEDDSKIYGIQSTLWGYDLDSSNGCEESCEAY